MDELKLKLSTKFMRGIVAKVIGMVIEKKLGCSIDVFLNNIEVATIDDKIQLHVDVDANMTNGEFTRLLNSILYRE